MIIVKLTEELLPHFIFLMDEIEASNSDLVISALLKECRNRDIETSWHSLSRAFAFRQMLKKGMEADQTYSIPKKKTLDALTKYCYGEAFIFRDLVRNSNDIDVDPAEVSGHYAKNLPKEETILGVFKKRPEKLEHVQEQFDTCRHILRELESCTMKEFIAQEVDQRFDRLKKEVNNELELQSELIHFLEARLEKLERKMKRSLWIHRLFGSWGLFFVTIDYDELDKTRVLEDFVDAYQGLLQEEGIDEML